MDDNNADIQGSRSSAQEHAVSSAADSNSVPSKSDNASACNYRTYKLTMEYNGSNYQGFQRQQSTSLATPAISKKRKRGAPCTIQDKVEEALMRLTNQSISDLRCRMAGRTDKGVHATGQVVAFDYYIDGRRSVDDVSRLTRDTKCIFDQENDSHWSIIRAMNAHLPEDIFVRHVSIVPRSLYPFEARKNIMLKRYQYIIRFRPKGSGRSGPICESGVHTIRKPSLVGRCWICPWSLDPNVISRVCARMEGAHDFSSFVHKAERNKKDNVINLLKFQAQVYRDDDGEISSESENDNTENKIGEEPLENKPMMLKFTVEARGFRRGMVRLLVGFVIDVARGKVKEDEVDLALNSSNDSDDSAYTVHSAPACGLYLAKVKYSKNL